MSEFQFFKSRSKEVNDDVFGLSREEMQEVARKFNIPNTDHITKDSNGNYYHGGELLNDHYLRQHNTNESGQPPQKHY